LPTAPPVAASLTATRGPWKGGYTSSKVQFLASPDQLTGSPDGSDTNSSRDCVIDPVTGGVSRRSGVTILNDTVDVNKAEVAGILDFVPINSLKTRKLFAIDSPSLDNGYPTLAGLFGEDSNHNPASGFPTTDIGTPATIWLNSTNSAAVAGGNTLKNYSLLSEFANGVTYSNSPSTKATAADYRLRVVPIWYESGDGVYNRGALTGTAGTDKFNQKLLACGSRGGLQTQNWYYSPNLRATPWRWNKQFNESSTVGTSTVRIYPTGPLPPLWPFDVAVGTLSANDSSWSAGDTFFISVVFQFEDGSYSAPFIPRAINATLTNGLGFVTVGTIASGSKYKYLSYTNIPLGPEGTVARILLRTPKQNRTAVTDAVTVSPLDLRVLGVLRNNTQDDYDDYAGDDNSLLEDEDVVRVDYTMPRRARYIGTGDQRVLISYTLPNTAAILLAPTGVTTAHDRNNPDTSDNCYSATGSYVRITSTQLELHYNGGAAAPNFGGGGNAKAFVFATYDTLDKLVDAINATVVGDNCKAWSAQLAPGTDGTMPSSSLTLTTMDVAVTGTSTTTLAGTASAIAPIGVGMKVGGTNIVAGSYVQSKTPTTVTISTATTGAPGATTTFYSCTGDTESISGGTQGYIRAFSSTFPLLLHMKPSAFPGYATPDKSSVYFTVSSPGAATSGISLAPNSWLAGNRRLPHASPRQLHARSCTGIVDIEGAAIVAYSDGIHMFANQRGANSGEDFDYRLFTVNDTRGCISYLGLTAGNGWAAYPTPEGIVITDKNRREFVISGDIYNASDGTGDLTYEIGKSAASVASDSDDQHFSMAVRGSKLVVGVRGSATVKARFLEYDFSPGIEASGVEELLNPETKKSYIWSPPAIYNNDAAAGNCITPGAMGSIRNASGRIDYISYDTLASGLGGRIDSLNATFTDNGYIGYTTDAVVAPFVSADFKLLVPQRIEATHRTQEGAFNATYLQFANDQIPTFNATLQRLLKRPNFQFPNTSHTMFQRQIIPIDQTQRSKTDCFWVKWTLTTFPSGSFIPDRIWQLVLQYDELENTPRQAGEN